MPHSNDNVARPASWVTGDVLRILLSQVVFGFGWSLYLLTPKYLATVLRAGPDVIGTITATGGFAGLLTIPFAARGLDRFGRKLFFRLGALLIAVLSLGFLEVHDLGPLVYVLQGCVSAAFVLAYNASAALLTDYAPPQKLGQAIGWLGSANVAMNAVATMIAEPLAERYGWHVVFELGVVAGLAAFALTFLWRPAPSRPSTPPSAAGAGGPIARPGRGLAAILITTLFIGGTFIAVFGFVQPYAVSLGAREVRGFYLGFTLAAVSGRLFLGGLGDRLGRRRVSLWMLGGYALAALSVSELQPDWLIAYGFMFGAAHGLLYPTLNALVLEILSPKRRGFGMVLYNGAFNLGSSVGSLGWGMLAHHYGYPSVYVVASLLSAAALASLLFGTR
jgi:MFS family permease